MTMKGYVLTVERIVPAPPEVVFDILADVSQHHLIDGSGMLQGANEGNPQRLALGTSFGMGMKLLVYYFTGVSPGRRGPPGSWAGSWRAGCGVTSWHRSTGAPWSGRVGTSPTTTSASC